jgi:hypothetical protein
MEKTAWFLDHRIRLAMQDEYRGGRLGGEIEVDETFIGGKARNMHKDRKRKVQAEGRNTGGKTVSYSGSLRHNGGRIHGPDRAHSVKKSSGSGMNRDA